VGTVGGKLGAMSSAVFQGNLMRETLEAFRITSVADLQGHRIIGKPMLDNYLSNNQIPANTDYYPFVDQHAEKAFFKKSSAKDILKLKRIWLLTNPAQQKKVLGFHTRRRGTELTRNSYDATFLERLFKDNLLLKHYGDVNVPVEPYEMAVSVSRILYRCNPNIVEDTWLKDAFWLSDITTVYGVPDLITPFWEVLVNGECFPHLPERVQSAFRFFLAASQRNNVEIIRQGRLLAGADFRVEGFSDYRLLHMLAAYERLGRPRAAAGFVATLKDLGELSLENRVLATHLVDEARKLTIQTPQPIRVQ
jgi:hypothetical protein